MALKDNSANANYSFETKDVRPKTWGKGEYANLPQKPMNLKLGNKHDYRDGIINGFNCEISEVTGIEENGKLW